MRSLDENVKLHWSIDHFICGCIVHCLLSIDWIKNCLGYYCHFSLGFGHGASHHHVFLAMEDQHKYKMCWESLSWDEETWEQCGFCLPARVTGHPIALTQWFKYPDAPNPEQSTFTVGSGGVCTDETPSVLSSFPVLLWAGSPWIPGLCWLLTPICE